MGALFVPGNRIALLKNGAAFFPALEAAIDGAKADVRLETYIFQDDAAGRRIAHALMRAAARGVAVRVLVDGFGSRQIPPAFFEEMRRTGVRVLFFRPDRGLLRFRRSRLRRVHRKIALIDGRLGFVGGINIIDDFTENLSPTHPRLDYAVLVEGPILADIYPAVLRLWRIVKWTSLKRRDPAYRPPAVACAACGPVALQFLQRDNLRHRRDIEHAYLRAIDGAQRSILLTSPYFLPGRRLRRALCRAAQRGVAVVLLLQGEADHPLLQYATRALYDQLLSAGVVVHEYTAAMLHGKVAVVDGEWATVGSSNLDPFSLFLNREANVVARDHDFAETLQQSVEEEIAAHARRVDPLDWRRRGVWMRLKCATALLLARMTAGLIGMRRD